MTSIRTFVKNVVPEPAAAPAAAVFNLLRVRWCDWEKRPGLLIYQMGSVGSSTLYQALREAGFPYPIFHVHMLAGQNIANWQKVMSDRKSGFTARMEVAKTSLLGKRVEEDRSRPIRMITLVRDPVRQRVSEFFQFQRATVKDWNSDDLKDSLLGSVQKMFARFDEPTDRACSWFDREFKKALDIDVYAHPFDSETGFTIISAARAEVLIVKLEDIDACLDRALNAFLGIERPENMERKNVGSDKEYGVVYRHVLQHLQIPESILAKIYSSRYAQHFNYSGYNLYR